ncbi:MAG TPA: fibronectin type III domain-containing protein, partial [Flavobacteriales bacterium]|nr:fibronectin type III domain-containing protein [Flavobacteriales bacterium]
MARTRPLLLGGALLLAGAANAQVLFNEQFTGGASTTGFTVENLGGDCEWIYAPGGLTPNAFNRDFGGALPSGAGFDSDFSFIDSDECTGNTETEVNTVLVSAPFDASQAGSYVLRFSHQFQARLESFARVEVFDGTDWTEVAYWTETSVGYPNPATVAVIDITTACNASATAQVRFQFSSGWDWWWALDNISVTRQACTFPEDVAVGDISQTGATVSWTDNGAPGYTWVITTGGLPDGTNTVATGDETNTVATGLLPGQAYTAFVEADCGDLTTSGFGTGVAFLTRIANDECAAATALTVNPDDECGTVMHGTVMGATDSGVTTDCFGTPDDDVWFSFVATNAAHYVSLLNVNGDNTDMYHALWTGDCASLTLVDGSCSDGDFSLVSGLTVGTTYYVQVYTYGEGGANTQFDVCIGTPPPPPANDECAGAVSLTVNPDAECGTVTHGSTASATGSGLTSDCFGTADDDVWYRFVATNTSHYVSLNDVTGSTTDMYFALWTGDCTSLTQVEGSCSDPEFAVISGLTVGTPYYVQVYTYTDVPGQTSEYDICIGTPPPPPANDECAGAVALTVNPDLACGSVAHGSVASATGSGLTSDCFGSADDDVWYSFVATNATHYVSILNSEGPNTDMYHAVWTGDCASLTLVEGSCSDGDLSSVSGLAVGTTYYVQVYTYTDQTGQTTSFDVCVGTPPPPPANDECAAAVALTVNPDDQCGTVTHGSVTSATGSGLTSTCFGEADDDVWFSFVATNASHYVNLLNSSGSDLDLYHAVWGGDCANLTLMPGSCADGDESIVGGLTVGNTYYVQVYTYTDQPGQDTEFDVCIGTPGPGPANDDCGGAVALTVNNDLDCGVVTAGTVATATPSGVVSPDCYGTADDDVWYSFVATVDEHVISLNDVTGSTGDMYMALWTGACGS